MHKFLRISLKWLIGGVINFIACVLLYLIVRKGLGWSFMECVLIGGLFQLVLIVPNYIREINIQPQGPPATLKGMSRYDVNDNPQFIGIKKMVEPSDLRPEKELPEFMWFFLQRKLFQKLFYAVLMIGISLTYNLIKY